MLHGAAATHPKVRACWGDALRTAPQDVDQLGPIEPRLTLYDTGLNPLARESTLHEDNLAVVSRHTLTFQVN
jgi:hypothetical protein